MENYYLYDIKRDYFSYENKALYDYIEKLAKNNKYTDLPILQYEFQIKNIMEYTQIGELDNMCNSLIDNYFKERIKYELGDLNEDIGNQMIDKQPREFAQKMSEMSKRLGLIGAENHSFRLFDNIEEILKIGPNDVIRHDFLN